MLLLWHGTASTPTKILIFILSGCCSLIRRFLSVVGDCNKIIYHVGSHCCAENRTICTIYGGTGTGGTSEREAPHRCEEAVEEGKGEWHLGQQIW